MNGKENHQGGNQGKKRLKRKDEETKNKRNTENMALFMYPAVLTEVTSSRAGAIESQLRQQLGEFSQAVTTRRMVS